MVVALDAHAAHPDHRHLAGLVRDCAKLCAIARAPGDGDAPALAAPRLWFAEAEWPMIPQALIPLEEEDWRTKQQAIRCYASQFDGGVPTSINAAGFLEWIDARGRAWGRHAGSPYAEALRGDLPPRLGDLRGA